jgi:preprotein translocase subunit SecG
LLIGQGVFFVKLVLQIFLLIISVALVVVIVIQPSKGEGLGAIGSGGQVFFAKNKGLEKLLDKITMWLAITLGLLLIFVELYDKIF